MSQRLISLSPDLKRLRDEGYNVTIRAGYLVIDEVPYVTAEREVKRGTLVCALTMAGESTEKPATHVMMFIGEYPCDQSGRPLEAIRAGDGLQLTPELHIDFQFSSKPVGIGAYSNYYDQVRTYAAILSSPAQTLDPTSTPMTFPLITIDEDESVFHYLDTASSRANILSAMTRLRGRIGIVGLGGTGSYVLDLVAKTGVDEIHLFDGDDFLSHNAFRAPGAPSIEELNTKPKKVVYLSDIYSRMRAGIVPHEVQLTDANLDLLDDIDFVFLCIDAGSAKRAIVDKLEANGVSFIDVGLGVQMVETSLRGALRVTLSTSQARHYVHERTPFVDPGPNDDYATNIQIADLNALNAALAVIKWKKLAGFYFDFNNEHNITYTVNTNSLASEDIPG